MTIRIATALATGSASEAAEAIGTALENDLDADTPALIMVYASTAQPLSEVTSALDARFSSACVIGASTAGEFVETGDAKSAVSAIAIAGDVEAHAALCRAQTIASTIKNRHDRCHRLHQC